MDTIKISLAEVTSCANNVRTLNQRMYETLMSMKKDMNDLQGTWISDAGETCRARFNQFATRFETQKEVIDQYARFLDHTVSSYDTLESTLNANASSFSQ